MSIEPHPGKRTLSLPAPVSWGEISPQGQSSLALRFELANRIVTFPIGELRRWEYAIGEIEVLTISTPREQIVIEGQALGPVRAALDLGRLCAVRVNYKTDAGRPGPKVTHISIETA